MKIKDKINQTIANNIKLARISAGITQEELARRTGYTDRSSIAKIEKGIVDLPQSKIQQFADALGVTPGYLTGWDDEAGENEASPAEPKLSEGEKALLELFRRVPEDQQELVLQMIRAALSTQK